MRGHGAPVSVIPAVAASVGAAAMPLWAVVPAFVVSVAGILIEPSTVILYLTFYFEIYPVQVGVADVESEGPSRAAGGGLVDRLPVSCSISVRLHVCASPVLGTIPV